MLDEISCSVSVKMNEVSRCISTSRRPYFVYQWLRRTCGVLGRVALLCVCIPQCAGRAIVKHVKTIFYIKIVVTDGPYYSFM
jgi:hypothetical protein